MCTNQTILGHFATCVVYKSNKATASRYTYLVSWAIKTQLLRHYLRCARYTTPLLHIAAYNQTMLWYRCILTLRNDPSEHGYCFVIATYGSTTTRGYRHLRCVRIQHNLGISPLTVCKDFVYWLFSASKWKKIVNISTMRNLRKLWNLKAIA